MLKTLYGLLKPKTGTVCFHGKPVTGLKVHEFIRKGIAYVPQLRSIFPDLTVRENLELGTWIFKKDKKARRARALTKFASGFRFLEKNGTSAQGF